MSARQQPALFEFVRLVRLDRKQLGIHLPWGLFAAALTIALVGWHVIESSRAGQWLGGGSASGLACGTAAGLIIAFEMLLWPRKYFRRLRLFPARLWMAAHLWLGLASLPLAVFHCGWHLGGRLPTWFLILFVLTILSGIVGLILQNIIPKLILQLLPAETIYSEIEHVAEQSINDLRQAIIGVCGLPAGAESKLSQGESSSHSRSTVVLGAVREIGLIRGRTLRTRTVARSEKDRDVLWNAFAEIEPFLSGDATKSRAFGKPADASRWFAKLRRACSQNSEPVIESLEQCYEQRLQFNMQRRLHLWLHAWLPVHIGLSVAVSVLLIVHIFTALKYW